MASPLGVLVLLENYVVFYESQLLQNASSDEHSSFVSTLKNKILQTNSSVDTNKYTIPLPSDSNFDNELKSNLGVFCQKELKLTVGILFENLTDQHISDHQDDLFEISNAFYNKIKSYFTDPNIDTIPLYILRIRCKSLYSKLMSNSGFLRCISCGNNNHNTYPSFDYNQQNQQNLSYQIEYTAHPTDPIIDDVDDFNEQKEQKYPVIEMREIPKVKQKRMQKESEQKYDTNESLLLLPDKDDWSGGKSNIHGRMAQINKLLQEKKMLERELQVLDNAADPVESARRIMDFIMETEEPFQDPENPMINAAGMAFGFSLPDLPGFESTFKEQLDEWNAARKLVDNVFTDLENLFYILSQMTTIFSLNWEEWKESIIDASNYFVKVCVLILFCIKFIFWVLIQLIIYGIIVTMTVCIILPSCFFLLIMRMTKVETTMDGLEERDELLRRETCCQRLYRLIVQLIRSSFMFMYLVIYPYIITYKIIPKYNDKDYVAMIAISTYLFSILALQLFGTVRSFKSYKQRKVKEMKYEHKKFKYNIGSFIAICLSFYQVLQLAMFAYNTMEIDIEDIDNVEYTFDADSLGINSKGMIKFADFISNICYISIDFIEANVLDYYIIFAMVFVGLLLLFCIVRFIYELRKYAVIRYEQNDLTAAHKFYFHSFLGTIIYGHGHIKNVNKFTSKIISLLSDTLFLAICQKIVLILSCTKDNILRINENEQCWIGKHKLYATISLILLGYYIPICTMISPMFSEHNETETDDDDEENMEDHEEKQEKKKKNKICEFFSFSSTVQFVSPFLSALVTSECFMLISSEFVSKGHVIGIVISQSISMMILYIITINWSFSSLSLYGLTDNEPSFPFGSSIIRSFGFIAGFGACIIMLFTYFKIFDNAVALFLTYLLLIICGIISFLIFYKYHAIYNHLDDGTEQNEKIIMMFDTNNNRMKLIIPTET